MRRLKLNGFTGIVKAILEATRNPEMPRKQRHTAHRMFDRLSDERGFMGGDTIMKDNVRSRRQSTRDAFVSPHHLSGHTHVDFAEAVVEIGGQRMNVASLCLILPYSDECFEKAYPRETRETFQDGRGQWHSHPHTGCQPDRTAPCRDQATHQGRRHPPQRKCHHPSGRSRAPPAERRVGCLKEIHDTGIHRLRERQSHRLTARCGILSVPAQTAGNRVGRQALAPRVGTRSIGPTPLHGGDQ